MDIKPSAIGQIRNMPTGTPQILQNSTEAIPKDRRELVVVMYE